MPRISAPTVAEHRALQREALVRAAAAELLENGLASVSPASVGKRAGLARSSVYSYFASATELLAEVAVRSFEDWSREIDEAMATAPSGLERLTTYIAATLRMVAEGKHGIADAMSGVTFSEEQSLRFMKLHVELVRPLREVMNELGLSDPELRVEIVQGVVDAATKLVNRGVDLALVTRLAVGLVLDGLVPDRPVVNRPVVDTRGSGPAAAPTTTPPRKS